METPAFVDPFPREIRENMTRPHVRKCLPRGVNMYADPNKGQDDLLQFALGEGKSDGKEYADNWQEKEWFPVKCSSKFLCSVIFNSYSTVMIG